MQLPSGKTCQAERFSRRNRQALRGWGLSNASARWRNFLGAIASCRIVKCSRQAAKLAGRRSSLLLLPNHAGAPNAADRRQNLPGGEVLSAQLPSPAGLGIVECSRQTANLPSKEVSLSAALAACGCLRPCVSMSARLLSRLAGGFIAPAVC